MNDHNAYQDSGFEWIGKVPNDWTLSRAGKYFTERSEKVDDVTYPPLSVTMSGIVDQLSDVAKTSDGENRKLVKKNDFVINSRSDRKGSSGIAPRDGSVSLINIVLEPHDIDPQFIQNLLKSYYFKEEFFRNGKGIHWDLWTTRWDQLKNINIPIPSHKEQKLISRYLDKKTSQIDSLISKIVKKIELLKEQRISLIDKYVTKGLNPNVEMKDSGVEWIGEIPKHWKISPLFNIFEENKAKNKEGRLDVLTLSYGKIKYRDLSKLEGLIPESFDGYQVMEVESIIVRSTDLQNDHKSLRVGHVGIPGVITSAYLGLNPKQRVSTKFYYYSIHLSDLKKVLYGLGGGLRQSLRFDDFKRFPIIHPPEDEREKISNHLDKLDTEITTITSRLERRIALMEEYRQSLVSFAVTGKIRVTEEMV
jgi:type I restriction enzyme S subunit